MLTMTFLVFSQVSFGTLSGGIESSPLFSYRVIYFFRRAQLKIDANCRAEGRLLCGRQLMAGS